jgi:pimeloyl-ACP methyl ester carboxylesterase
MKRILVFITSGIIAFSSLSYAQVIEPCDCPVKVDSGFKTQCGYLIVPENRKKNNGKMIKLPFIVVKSNNPNKKHDPLLFTTGGPGGSSLGWVNGAIRNGFTDDRDCIAFEQRGTRFAIPNLWSEELPLSIQESYRKNLPKDSMVLVGVKRYKKALEARGIDLSGYNTDETVNDIHDLLNALKIDSVNLLGGSYSGGLMLAVLAKDPSRIRSLVLDSPLPTFVPIDEDEPANLNEALNVLFRHCEKDSVNKELYGDLKGQFQEYFSSIEGKVFYMPYVEKEKDKQNTLSIQYTRNDLLNVIENRMVDYPRIKEVPYVITELIKGHHDIYIKEILDDIFLQKPGPSGMRISVYCADQTAYHDEAILHQLNNAYPYMKGYHINDVYREMCDCWKVPPIAIQTKQPYYSRKPVLLGDGEMDPACRPLYIDMIHHYMPNSQRLLYINKSHMVFGGKESYRILKVFLDNPLRKIETEDKDIIVY